MPLHDTETGDLIAELMKRMNRAAYRSHKAQLDALSFRIAVEQQDAETTKKGIPL